MLNARRGNGSNAKKINLKDDEEKVFKWKKEGTWMSHSHQFSI